MRQVICVGDSIRWGYEPTVVRELSGWAQVTEMGETQGGDTRNVLAHLDEWVLSRSFDIIHFNAGLHDIIREVGPGPAPRVPCEEYRENLRRIFSTIQERSAAHLIFALTTPVDISRQLAVNYPCNRINEDVIRYNDVATEVATALGVQINDLYQVVVRNDMSRLHDTDGVHYTLEGSAILGKHVAAAIRRQRTPIDESSQGLGNE